MSLSNAQHEYFHVTITRTESEMLEALRIMKSNRYDVRYVQRYVLLSVRNEILRSIYDDMLRLRY